MERSGNIRRSVASALRRTMLFGIGSALILHEKAQEFVEEAIERGRETQKEGKKLVQEMRSRQAPDVSDSHVADALARLDLPSRKDVEELDRHVAALSERVDELQTG
jgi:polyhydroxyalkanoate synthesis regulator phasin